MRVTLEITLDLFNQLKLPDIASKIVTQEKLPFDLDIYFGCIGEFFLMTEKEQFEYTQNRYYPLWDDGNFDRITAYDKQTQKFLMYYVESPEDGINKQYSYEQLMYKEFKYLWEAEIEDDHLRSIATLFCFNNIEHFLSDMNSIIDLDYDQYEDEFDRCVSQISS